MGGSENQMRSEAEKIVQIGAHGSMAAFDTRDALARTSSSAHDSSNQPQASLIEIVQKRTGGPKITGYENNDCGGTILGSYMLPIGADYRTDHCLEVKDADTGDPNGRVKVSCDASGVAKVCIWKSANDTACELSEPFCLNIQNGDTPLVSTGGCLPVKEHPKERDSYARFTDFPENTQWPDCLVPPMSQSLMIMVMGGGAAAGLVLLCGIWFTFFSAPSHKTMGGMHSMGMGKGKGKGWGGYEEPAHPSGEVDASGNPLPESLPGVPPAAQPREAIRPFDHPGAKGMKGDHMMKGKGGPPGGFKGGKW